MIETDGVFYPALGKKLVFTRPWEGINGVEPDGKAGVV